MVYRTSDNRPHTVALIHPLKHCTSTYIRACTCGRTCTYTHVHACVYVQCHSLLGTIPSNKRRCTCIYAVHTITFGHRTITDQYTHVTDYVRLWSVKMSERDNARIINYIVYWPAVRAQIMRRARLLGKANDSMGVVFINSPLGLHNILLAKCSPKPLFLISWLHCK